jgi:hypothetical protein
MTVIRENEDIARIRKLMQDKKGGGQKDPNEFRFPKAKENETLTYYIKFLPPVPSMGDLWFYMNGSHFLDMKRLECPRIHEQGAECPLCQLGFQLMDGMDKEQKSKIAKTYLARSYYGVNIYFPQSTNVQEDLRGKVFWANIPKTLYDKCEECILRDDGGSDDDPAPFGLFYSEKAGYVMKVVIKSKGGYNNYEESKFLVTTKGPLSKDEAKIKEILAKRHDVPTKFAARDLAALQAKVDNILKKSSTATAGDDAGFHEDHTEEQPAAAKPAPATKPAAAKPAPAAAAKPAPAAKPAAAKPAPPAEEFQDEVTEETPAKPSAKAAPAKAAPEPEESPADGGPIADAEIDSLLKEIKDE